MTTLTAKTAAFTVLIALGALMSSSAHAGVLVTSAGVPVTTAEGTPVLTVTPSDEVAAPTPEAVAPKHECDRERVVYFDFNKSTLTKHAQKHLDHVAAKLHAHHVKSITVVGFADRLGNAAYNEKLALARAKAVHDYLVGKGVKAKKIEVRSLGKSESKTDCAATLPHAKLISCLKEDRRVEIEFDAAK
jgi:OOP family OmpA-OmpF porin